MEATIKVTKAGIDRKVNIDMNIMLLLKIRLG
jgi:hypothetical protein